MGDKIHVVERFCRNMLSSYPGAVKAIGVQLENKASDSDAWPGWCELPMSYVYSALTIEAVDSDDAIRLIGKIGLEKIAELTAAFIWMRYRVVYRFDNDFSEVLMEQPFEGDIPGEALNTMPFPCVYVEKETILGEELSTGFFAWVDWDARESKRKLQFLFLLRSGDTYLHTLPIVGSLDDSLKALHDSCVSLSQTKIARKLDAEITAAAKMHLSPDITTVAGCLNHLLYLCSEEPDIPDIDRFKQRRTHDRNGIPKRTASLEVGTRIGSIFRKAKQGNYASASEMNSGHRSQSVPHIRRAHWHHYWTGPKKGERILVLKWLSPILVNADDCAEFASVVHKAVK
jgi:hypothetical protein